MRLFWFVNNKTKTYEKTLSICILFVIAYSNKCSEQTYIYIDAYGNQTSRNYVAAIKTLKTTLTPIVEDENDISKKFNIYPNPVITLTTIKWDADISDQLEKIEMVSYNGGIINQISFSKTKNSVDINMSNKSSGIYYLKIYMKENKIVNHSIIKN